MREARIRTVPCQWVWILTTCERPLGLEISRVLGPILLLASLATRLWPRLPNNHFLFSLSFSQSRFHSPFSPVVLTSRAHALNLGKNTVCFVVYLWPLNLYNSREERSLASLNSEDDTYHSVTFGVKSALGGLYLYFLGFFPSLQKPTIISRNWKW